MLDPLLHSDTAKNSGWSDIILITLAWVLFFCLVIPCYVYVAYTYGINAVISSNYEMIIDIFRNHGSYAERFNPPGSRWYGDIFLFLTMGWAVNSNFYDFTYFFSVIHAVLLILSLQFLSKTVFDKKFHTTTYLANILIIAGYFYTRSFMGNKIISLFYFETSFVFYIPLCVVILTLCIRVLQNSKSIPLFSKDFAIIFLLSFYSCSTFLRTLTSLMLPLLLTLFIMLIIKWFFAKKILVENIRTDNTIKLCVALLVPSLLGHQIFYLIETHHGITKNYVQNIFLIDNAKIIYNLLTKFLFLKANSSYSTIIFAICRAVLFFLIILKLSMLQTLITGKAPKYLSTKTGFILSLLTFISFFTILITLFFIPKPLLKYFDASTVFLFLTIFYLFFSFIIRTRISQKIQLLQSVVFSLLFMLCIFVWYEALSIKNFFSYVEKIRSYTYNIDAEQLFAQKPNMQQATLFAKEEIGTYRHLTQCLLENKKRYDLKYGLGNFWDVGPLRVLSHHKLKLLSHKHSRITNDKIKYNQKNMEAGYFLFHPNFKLDSVKKYNLKKNATINYLILPSSVNPELAKTYLYSLFHNHLGLPDAHIDNFYCSGRAENTTNYQTTVQNGRHVFVFDNNTAKTIASLIREHAGRYIYNQQNSNYQRIFPDYRATLPILIGTDFSITAKPDYPINHILTYGPYLSLQANKKHKIALVYSNSLSEGNAGIWQVTSDMGKNIIREGVIPATNGEKKSIEVEVFSHDLIKYLEFRTFMTKANSNLRIYFIEVIK